MRRPRVRFTVRGLMVIAVAAGWAFAYRATLAQAPSPRSLLPPITAAYLTWAMFDSVLARCAVSPRAWYLVPALLCLLLGVDASQRRVSGLRRMAAAHGMESQLCRWGAEGRGGVLRVHFSDGCRSWVIPTAKSAAERANLIERAEEHARWEARYERAATRPWIAVEPGDTWSRPR